MSIPANIIIAWSGAINQIPTGWVLCNGQNNTPDLRNRFVVGAGNSYALNATGGSADAILVSHNHTGSTSTSANHTHSITFRNAQSNAQGTPPGRRATSVNLSVSTDAGGSAHTHVVTLSTEGVNEVNKNLPPYYALAFIMKEAE
jgi:microcystin-dependent protein